MGEERKPKQAPAADPGSILRHQAPVVTAASAAGPQAQRRRISDEPLIIAIHARVVELALLSYVALLVYMSFVPFDFTAAGTPWSGPGLVLGLQARPLSLADIIANIALYVPLGAGAFAVLRRRGWRRLFSTPFTLLLATVLSLLIEHSQHWVAARVPAWPDVVANVLGAILGTLLAMVNERPLRRVLESAGSAARRNWPLTLAKAAVCLLLAVQLRPYDAVVDAFHTATSLRYADFSPTTAWSKLPATVARETHEGRRRSTNELPRVQWEYALDRLGDTAGYALVAALVAAGLAAQFSSRLSLYAWSGFVSVSLAALLTMMRVFLISHGLDTAHFFCGAAGWPLGCVLAHLVLKRGDAETSEGQNTETATGSRSPAWHISLPRWLVPTTMAAVLAVLLLYELVPFDFGETVPAAAHHASVRQVCLVPFAAHFRSRPNDAFLDISGDLLRYGLTGVCLSLILRHRSKMSWRRQVCAVTALTGIIAACFEGLHVFMPSRLADITTVLLALAGAFSGTVAVRWVYDYRASLRVVIANDPLTTQLIEGRTYLNLPAGSAEPLARR